MQCAINDHLAGLLIWPRRVQSSLSTTIELTPWNLSASSRAEGYGVETAATAEGGLARAKQGNFDVVLTGLHLSGADESARKDFTSSVRCKPPNHSWL